MLLLLLFIVEGEAICLYTHLLYLEYGSSAILMKLTIEVSRHHEVSDLHLEKFLIRVKVDQKLRWSLVFLDHHRVNRLFEARRRISGADHYPDLRQC